MKKSISWMILFILTSFVFVSCSDDEDDIVPQAPTDYTSALQYIEASGFKGSILFRKGNTDLVRQGFGMADIANNIPNDVNTHFRIGSMSKAFTSLGIVQLKREGYIANFDQPISDFAEDFPFGDQITIRHLLTHSSGLPDHVGIFEEVVKDQNLFLTPEDILDAYAEALAEDGLQFSPGTLTSYSNANYLLLGLFIEELAEMPYHDYFAQHNLGQLEMQDTYLSPYELVENGEAKGYKEGSLVAPYPVEIAFGAGDWVSNLEDMEKWGDAWMGNLITTSEKEEVFPMPVSEGEITSFGMGWFTIRIGGTLVYFHGGDIDGYTSLIALFPETNSLLIALSNEQDKRNQLDTMMEVFANEEF